GRAERRASRGERQPDGVPAPVGPHIPSATHGREIVMTQDQYGQAREPGYVVRGDPIAEAEDARADESKPKTTFQKVASALRGDKASDQDETKPNEPAANRVSTSSEDATGSDVMTPGSDRAAASPPYVTETDEAAMANTP